MAKEHTAVVKEILLGTKPRTDCYLWGNNTGAYKIGRRFVRYGHPGSPDIVGYDWEGKFIGIEVKIPPDKLSDKQIIFQDRLKNASGHYVVVSSAAAAFAFLDSITPISLVG